MANEKKYQVFISSTYEDLIEERRQATNAVLKLHQIAVGMELFNAGNSSQWEEIKRQIDISDYYIVIVGNKYGSEDETGISYTEKEYRYATDKGIPVIGFVISDRAKQEKSKYETVKKKIEKLNKFKALVKSRMVEFWLDGADLNSKVTAALAVEMAKNPQQGWVRATDTTDALKELVRLNETNKKLQKEIDRKDKIINSQLKSIDKNNIAFSLKEIDVEIEIIGSEAKKIYEFNKVVFRKVFVVNSYNLFLKIFENEDAVNLKMPLLVASDKSEEGIKLIVEEYGEYDGNLTYYFEEETVRNLWNVYSAEGLIALTNTESWALTSAGKKIIHAYRRNLYKEKKLIKLENRVNNQSF